LTILCLIFTTLLSSCSNSNPVLQEGWDPREPDYGINFSFDTEEKWLLIQDSYREGVVLLEYQYREPDNPFKLVVTILPVSYSNHDLVLEMHRMMELSLHNHTLVNEVGEKYISGYQVFTLAAEAGLENTVYASSAGLNYKGRTYMMTMLATSDTSLEANKELDLIVSSLELD